MYVEPVRGMSAAQTKQTVQMTTDTDNTIHAQSTEGEAEYTSYEPVDGIWYYGSAWQDYERSDNKTVIILTPSGYEDFLRELPDVKHTSIYLYANNTTIKNRLIKRGDSKDEAERRLKSDNRDFKDAQALAQKIVYNNAGARLEDVCNKILEYMETNN